MLSDFSKFTISYRIALISVSLVTISYNRYDRYQGRRSLKKFLTAMLYIIPHFESNHTSNPTIHTTQLPNLDRQILTMPYVHRKEDHVIKVHKDIDETLVNNKLYHDTGGIVRPRHSVYDNGTVTLWRGYILYHQMPIIASLVMPVLLMMPVIVSEASSLTVVHSASNVSMW